MTTTTADVPVRKSITVQASAERAFRVFTEEFDTWWPRTHHIGKSPMKKAIIEGRARGPLLHRTGRRHRMRLGHGAGVGAAAPVRDGMADNARVGL